MKIILVRHAETTSNVNEEVLRTVPNHLVELTELGKSQAYDLGIELKRRGITSAKFICSPYIRTRQTFDEIDKSITCMGFKTDYRIREIDVGNFVEDFEKIREERMKIGKFYYRFPNGESIADVAVRVELFLNDLRKFDNDGYPVVIVTHAATMRVMQFLINKLSIEQFESLDKPKNCDILELWL
jgi:broad specificity phosphatase PhoE